MKQFLPLLLGIILITAIGVYLFLFMAGYRVDVILVHPMPQEFIPNVELMAA